MTEAAAEIFDSQINSENVGFLDKCFDNSFILNDSLLALKEYIASEKVEASIAKENKESCKVKNVYLQNNSNRSECSASINSAVISQLIGCDKIINKRLKDWGLPTVITLKYEQKGIIEMFDWQVDCLSNSKVLLQCKNLVYSAPTSAGKTLVAEILTIKTILERQKKVIIILPFVSIVREKMFYMQDILSSAGIRVEGFMGSQSPPGGFQAVHVAICTIEKANSLVNRLLDEGNISDLGAVVVDELHLLGDPHRGYILELLLAKLKYISSKPNNAQIQIIGMSATLPNLGILANWLKAELYITQFRPIPLEEYCLVGNKYYDGKGNCASILSNTNADCDSLLDICLNTIEEGCSVLIFCMTKNRCESLAQHIASSFRKLGCSENEIGLVLRNQLKSGSIMEVLEQLKNCPVGLDQILKITISFGVAFHHAGLTFDERDIIEGAFKSGAVRVLVATSTLSSGVNLPARRVVIRSPVFQRQPINILSYKQMIGRAGRMGKDRKGESILICTEAEKKIGFDLMMGTLEPVESCIQCEDKYMRAMLEIIASQVTCTKEDLQLYSKCTLLFAQQNMTSSQHFLLENTLDELKNLELVREQLNGEEKQFIATSLGKACLSSSMAPNDGLSLFYELQKARQCLVLETDLHLIYLVTPYSVSSQWTNMDWLHLLTLWESLTKAMKRVGELVGVQESFIIRCLRGVTTLNNIGYKLNIHKRFYTALALQDLVNEVPLSEVAAKFQCPRGFLQSLQQSAATFAGMVTAFCHQLGWRNMEMLISQFQDRLHFGVHSDLLELMKLPSLNGMRARTLFNAGFDTISSIASAEVNLIENVLHNTIPFESEKTRDGDDKVDIKKRSKIKNIWITGYCGMTAKEAALNLISEARKFLEHEIGSVEIKWNNKSSSIPIPNASSQIPNVKCELKIYSDAINSKCLPEIDIKKESLKTDLFDLPQEDAVCVIAKAHQLGVISKDKVENNCDKVTVQSVSNVFNNPFIKSAEKANNVENLSSLTESTVVQTNCNAVLKEGKHNSQTLSINDDIVWDSLTFTEVGLDNIKTAENNFSPNVRSHVIENNKIILKKGEYNEVYFNTGSVKDISLFSSDGDNSSLFEDSLPLELLPSKFLNDKVPKTSNCKSETTSDFININSNSIINAFKSTVVESDTDEDIKLVYEDANKMSDELEVNLSEDVVINTQEISKTLSSKFLKSCSKPHTETSWGDKNDDQPTTKKKKLGDMSLYPRDHESEVISAELLKINSCKRSFALNINEYKLTCIVLEGKEILENFHVVDEYVKIASIYLNVRNNTSPSTAVIGSNILKQSNLNNMIKKDDPETSLLSGISIYYGKPFCFYLDLTSLDKNLSIIANKISHWFKKCIKVKVMSLKDNHTHVKKYLNIDMPQASTDISLNEWLIDSDEKLLNIFDLTKKYCNIDLANTHITIYKDNKSINNLDIVKNTCLKAWAVWTVAEKQEKYFSNHNERVENNIGTEIQVSLILANCEFYGLRVDKDFASQLLIDVKNSQEVLQKKAYKICGYHFNFNSAKDVAKVLGIYRGRKVSTRKSVLTSHNSPMASIVIFWRKLNSILTKTLYPLTEKACIYGQGDRIHPSYTMYTCTGRISMHEPNLQNVPRTFSIPSAYLTPGENIATSCKEVIEFNCRNIFQAAPGYVLVSADYCQLEMRILTHYCADELLTGIMNSNADVFKSIAASWGGVPEEQVDDDLRQKAKQLCYGIIYGMGNRTLSQHLDVSDLEAAVFMDTFHSTYPAIKVFTQTVIEDCKRKGYIRTLMKRRRYFPDINSTVMSKKSAAERQAINTTIQGSAADIAKTVMCAIHTRTDDYNPKPRLILQMHDELIYEVPETLKQTFIGIIRSEMENTVRLRVPLPVKVKSGYTWGSLKEVSL